MNEQNITLVSNALIDLCGNHEGISIEEIGAGCAHYIRLISVLEGRTLQKRKVKEELAGAGKK